MKVVFLGSADFGIPALKMLIEKHEVVGVVSTPPRKKGRGQKYLNSPITDFIRSTEGEETIPHFTPESFKEPDFLNNLKSCNADCFVVVAFRILPREVFLLPHKATVNIHASLLPRYRGPAPIHRAIAAGESATGVTVFQIDDGIDTGELLLQKSVPIGDQETTPELYSRLSVLGADALEEALVLLAGSSPPFQPQNQQSFCLAPKLHKSEALIQWECSARDIFNKIRAFKPYPGTYTLLNGKRLGIEWATPLEGDTSAEKGTVCTVGDTFIDVQTGSGVLRIHSVKPEGRKCMPVQDYINGTTLTEGNRFFE